MGKSKPNKPRTLFQMLSCIFEEKLSWDKLSVEDKKNFNVYMINRFISMDPDYIDIVNYLQKYNMNGMDKREAYKLYLDILPKKKFWSKYIKSKSKPIEVSSDIVKFIAKLENWSIYECVDNLKMLIDTNNKELITDYMRMHGYNVKNLKTYKIK